MRARRIRAPFPEAQPFDGPTLSSPAATGAESRAHTIARHREGQKDRLALALRDAVSLRTEALDGELNEFVRLLSPLRF